MAATLALYRRIPALPAFVLATLGLLPPLWLSRLRAYSQFRKLSTTSVNQDPAQAFSLSLPYRTLFCRSSLLP